MSWYNPFSWNWTGGQAGNSLPTTGDNYGTIQGYANNQLGQLAGRQAPTSQMFQLDQAAQLNAGQADQARAGQMGVANRLGAIATGQQAGAGELAVNRQIGQATAAQQAAARMSRGANAALAARAAARNTAGLGVAGAGQAQIAQLNDQAAANQQLAGIYGGMRGQDLDLAGQNAQLLQQRNMLQGQFGQQTNLANQQAQLQQTGMNDQAAQGYLASLMGLDQMQLQQLLAKQQLNAQDKGLLGQLMQIGGQVGAAYASGGMSGVKK